MKQKYLTWASDQDAADKLAMSVPQFRRMMGYSPTLAWLEHVDNARRVLAWLVMGWLAGALVALAFVLGQVAP